MGRIIILLFIIASEVASGADSASYYFVFLNANPERPTIERDSMERLQTGHLENMNRLYEEGKLVVSGPFGDSLAGGVFIFKSQSLDNVRSWLATDPAVAANRYKLDILPLSIKFGSICTAPDIFDIAKYPFLKLVHQKNLKSDRWREHEDYFDELARSKKILFRGMLGNEMSIAIFARNDNLDAAKAIVMNDPAVKVAELRPTLRMWWNAPGVFCEQIDQ